MQPLAWTRFSARRVRSFGLGFLIASLALFAAGCPAPTPPPAPPTPGKIHEGVTLRVVVPTAEASRLFADRTAGWTAVTGAKVELTTGQPEDRTDVLILRPGELGTYAARGELTPIPAALRAPSHSLQWDRTLSVYRANLTSWGAEPVALTLAADGAVLVYRADLFQDERHRRGFAEKYGGRRPLAAPATWEDVLDLASYFTEANKAPSLPAFPRDPERLLTQYLQLVACYNQDSRSEAVLKDKQENSLFFRVDETWRHRLDAPAFQAAMEWFDRTRPHRPAAGSEDDPVRALDQGTAVMAVLTLAELGRLPRDGDAIAAKFQLAPLPGTRGYFDADRKLVPVPRQANYIPYLGSGGWVGAVRTQSPSQAAAWDLLADLGGPASATALVSSPSQGVGPFRIDHIESTTILVRYRFDPVRSSTLADVLRHYVGVNVVNPSMTLRTPDRAVLMGSLESQLRKVATGQTPPTTAIQAAIAAWTDYEQTHPDPARLKTDRRRASGFE